MRIKFRAWDIRKNVMREVVVIHFNKASNVSGASYWSEDMELKSLHGNYIKLMQYTGLNDSTKWESLSDNEKNEWLNKGRKPEEWCGKPIYEGDVVMVAFHTGKTSTCEVVYNSLHARFEYVVLEMPIFTYSVSEVEEVAVIGNIYQNKDLLEGE